MIYEVIFDLETKTFFDETGRSDPGELGVSIVSLYKRSLDGGFKETKGELLSFWEDDFPKLWPVLDKADRVIGFNSKRFDAPALNPYAPADLTKLPHFDILEEIRRVHGKRVSLDRVATSTIGRGKTDDGANAMVYWKNGDKKSLEKLKKYCEADVLITKDVYDHALKHAELKFIDYWNTPHSVEVNFSYPADFIPKSKKSQIGLF